MTLTREDLQAVAALIEPVGSRLDMLETGQMEIKTDIAGLQERVESNHMSLVNIEMIHYLKIEAAMDGVMASIERGRARDGRLEILEDKADNHDIRIGILEGVMRK